MSKKIRPKLRKCITYISIHNKNYVANFDRKYYKLISIEVSQCNDDFIKDIATVVMTVEKLQNLKSYYKSDKVIIKYPIAKINKHENNIIITLEDQSQIKLQNIDKSELDKFMKL